MISWTCHVCKDERPDHLISVCKSKVALEGGIVVDQNVRYCNDRKECIERAPGISFFRSK